MGLFSDFGKALNRGAENVQKDKDVRLVKEMILEKMDIADIKLLLKRNNVGEPSNEEYYFLTQETKKKRLVKQDYIDHAARKISLDTIKEFAQRKKIKIDSILVEERQLEQERTKWRSNSEEMQSFKEVKEGNFRDVLEAIKRFEPSRQYNEERLYQTELVGFLKHKFPSANIEVQSNGSRPDIVIDNIAIEIKGPTVYKDLATIFDKCVRYTKQWDHFTVVLFAVDVDKEQYAFWESSLNEHFPDVIVMKKS